MEEALTASFAKKLNFDDSLSEPSVDSNETSDDDLIKNNETLQETVKEEHKVWRWWKEEDYDVSWKELVHCGPAFPPPYVPNRVLYEGREVVLSAQAEQMATMYARTLDHAYKSENRKKIFNDNFFKDWEKVLTDDDKKIIKDARKCDFTNMHIFYQNMNSTYKKSDGEKHGYCYVTSKRGDVYKERVSGYRVQAPDLCRTGDNRGLLRRVMPEDVTINCTPGKEPAPPPGHKWKQIVHNPSASWLASWKDNLDKQKIHYMKFDVISTYTAKCDYEKYELAKRLHNKIPEIRESYKIDWNPNKTLEEREMATALYFVDELALRVGSVCSLLGNQVKLTYDNSIYYVELNFMGKKKVKYYRKKSVDKLLYENLQQLKTNKSKLFASLTTQKVDKHLDDLMSGLTSKDFRTYHGSRLLEEKLDAISAHLSQAMVQKAPLSQDLIKQYKQLYANANIEVANLLNHVKNQTPKKPKGKQTPKKSLPKESSPGTEADIYGPNNVTSKEFYIDPRITAAWCKRNHLQVGDFFTEKQLEKFRWAIEMAEANPDFRFTPKPLNN